VFRPFPHHMAPHDTWTCHVMWLIIDGVARRIDISFLLDRTLCKEHRLQPMKGPTLQIVSESI